MALSDKLNEAKKETEQSTGRSSSPQLERQNEMIANGLIQIKKELEENTAEQKKTQQMLRNVYSQLKHNQEDLNDKILKLGSTGVDNYILAEQKKILSTFEEKSRKLTDDYNKQLEMRAEKASKVINDLRNTNVKALSIYEYSKMIGFYVVLILVVLTLSKAIHFGPYEGLGFSWFMKNLEGIGWLYWSFQGIHVLFWLFVVYTLYRGFRSYQE